MYLRLLLLSLLSLCFGCAKYPGTTKKFAGIPLFPQTDNPAFHIDPVPADTGFVAQAFAPGPDGERIFVLAFGLAGTPEHVPCRLLQYDTRGRITKRLDLPDSRWEAEPALFWATHGQLYVVLYHSAVYMIDPLNLEVLYAYRAMHPDNFLAREKLDQMTGDEQRNAYAEALRHAHYKSQSGELLQAPNAAFCCLLLTFKGKPDEAWHIPAGEEQEFIDGFGLQEIVQNFDARWGADGKSIGPGSSITEGDARLLYLARDAFDYKTRHPGIRGPEARIFEIGKGGKTARFKLTNANGGSLHLRVGADGYFGTADGSLWLLYERQLYRVAN